MNVDGNVTNFLITNNLIHDNDNIGIDIIGFEGVSPDPAYDYARSGTVAGNTVYNISAINNPVRVTSTMLTVFTWTAAPRLSSNAI